MRSTGSVTFTPAAVASLRNARARSSSPAAKASSLAPSARSPLALRSGSATPPPTTTSSTPWRSIMALSSLRLLFTEAPPTTPTRGRAAEGRSSRSHRSSSPINTPARLGLSILGTRLVDAWERCAVPNASCTNTSATAASDLAKASSSAVSPAWKRTFSKRRTSPGAILSTRASTASPTQSGARGQGCPRTSSTMPTTDFIEYSSSKPTLLGLPLWEMRSTLALAAVNASTVGLMAATLRDTSPSSFRSTLTRMRLPSSSEGAASVRARLAPKARAARGCRVGRTKPWATPAATSSSSSLAYSIVPQG
mmetsp:Transcript_10258/g.30625  ORF Transcript_10258/g.30625 Transcript_10258/m.30625 type:complete len:309 (+) Transcript_10258:593-1519(+)